MALGGRYLDRRLSGTSAGVSAVYSGGSTAWTLPYAVALDGSDGTLVVVRQADGEVIPSTRSGPNGITVTGDYTAAAVYLGILYAARYDLSTIYERDYQGRPRLNGRLTLRYLKVYHTNTTSLAALVQRDDRSDAETLYSSSTGEEGTMRVPVMGKNTEVAISFRDSTPGSFTLSAIEWEGTQAPRSHR